MIRLKKDHDIVKTGYIRTYKNHQFYFDDIENNVIDIEDIAHSLSNQGRWTGHTNVFYSLAEHSVLTSRLVSPEYAFEALMHDASEAYVVDLSRPLKAFVPDYRKIQHRVEKYIAEYFGLPYPLSEPVRIADDRLLQTEWETLFDKTEIWLGIKAEPFDLKFHCWNPEQAERAFLEAYESLETS